MNNRLRELRAVHRWSQADLADRVEVSRQTINSIETGRYEPGLSLTFKIARVFGEPIEALFFPDTDEQDTAPSDKPPTATPHTRTD